jgi:predicted small lipoprotein YifL
VRSRAPSSFAALLVLLSLGACKKDGQEGPDASPADAASSDSSAASAATQSPEAGAATDAGISPEAGADLGATLSWFLPDKAGRFVGAAMEVGPYYLRRKYAGPRGHMEVTISDARSPGIRRSPRGEPSDFFLRESSAYPQITLDIPKGTGSGFYDCVPQPGGGQRCSGYIMLFDGFHVEVLNDDATKLEVEALISELPLRKLATLR